MIGSLGSYSNYNSIRFGSATQTQSNAPTGLKEQKKDEVVITHTQPPAKNPPKKPEKNFWEKNLAAIIGITSIALVAISLVSAGRTAKAAKIMREGTQGGENPLMQKLTHETVFEDLAENKNIAELNELPGMQSAKAAIQRDIIEPIEHPDVFDSIGIGSVNAALWYGPPGTGKTNLLKSVAKTLKAKLAMFALSKDGSPFQHQDVLNINNRAEFVIQEATKNPNQRYIVGFDEIEGMLTEDKTGNSPNRQALVKTVLGILDKFKEVPNVTVIATTNETLNKKTGFLTNMNEAAMDRFPLKTFIDNPDSPAREGALKFHMRGAKKRTSQLASNAEDMKNLSEMLNGYSHRNISQISDIAKRMLAKEIIQAQKENKPSDLVMEKRHFTQAIEEFKKSKDPTAVVDTAMSDDVSDEAFDLILDYLSNPPTTVQDVEAFKLNMKNYLSPEDYKNFEFGMERSKKIIEELDETISSSRPSDGAAYAGSVDNSDLSDEGMKLTRLAEIRAESDAIEERDKALTSELVEAFSVPILPTKIEEMKAFHDAVKAAPISDGRRKELIDAALVNISKSKKPE